MARKNAKLSAPLDNVFDWYGFKSVKRKHFTLDLRPNANNLIINSEEMRLQFAKLYSHSLYKDTRYGLQIFITEAILDDQLAFTNTDYVQQHYPKTTDTNFKNEVVELHQILLGIRGVTNKIKIDYDKNKTIKFFPDIEHIFQSEDKIVFKDDAGKLRGGEIREIERHFSPMFGYYYNLTLNIITFTNENFKEATYSMYIESLAAIKSRNIQKIDDKTMAVLVKRGEKYVNYMNSKQKCWFYDAEAQYVSRFGLINKKVRSKIIVDAIYHDEINPYGDRHDSISIWNTDETVNKLDPAMYWMLPSHFKGISLKDKTPFLFDVDLIQPPVWNKFIFEELEIEENYKHVILSCVRNYGTVARNLVDGKNDGIILLLNGPPGVGKTLTAEAVSELTEKPLYKISIGDLGTAVDSLETNLKRILERASFWNAVLLIDEADVFLEKRSSNNIQQNYYVSIFLRLLEYFDGIMFLTTNRVQNIDKAFLSRITIPLNYKDLTVEQKVNILSNIFKRNKIDFLSNKELETLAEYPLNGRQYGSVIKIAISIASNENRQITFDDIKEASRIHTDFKDLD